MNIFVFIPNKEDLPTKNMCVLILDMSLVRSFKPFCLLAFLPVGVATCSKVIKTDIERERGLS